MWAASGVGAGGWGGAATWGAWTTGTAAAVPDDEVEGGELGGAAGGWGAWTAAAAAVLVEGVPEPVPDPVESGGAAADGVLVAGAADAGWAAGWRRVRDLAFDRVGGAVGVLLG